MLSLSRISSLEHRILKTAGYKVAQQFRMAAVTSLVPDKTNPSKVCLKIFGIKVKCYEERADAERAIRRAQKYLKICGGIGLLLVGTLALILMRRSKKAGPSSPMAVRDLLKKLEDLEVKINESGTQEMRDRFDEHTGELLEGQVLSDIKEDSLRHTVRLMDELFDLTKQISQVTLEGTSEEERETVQMLRKELIKGVVPIKRFRQLILEELKKK